jgi:hypothetical protein
MFGQINMLGFSQLIITRRTNGFTSLGSLVLIKGLFSRGEGKNELYLSIGKMP